MKASKWFLAAALLVLAACAHTTAITPDIAGTWRLVEYWDQESESQPKSYPFGEQPLGFIVYDRAGNVFVQIAKNPQPKRLSQDQLRRLDAGQLRATIEDYVSYFGTYTVDAAKGVVTHHVTADARREYTGTDQPRPFHIEGDELIIGDSKRWLRRLVRVRK